MGTFSNAFIIIIALRSWNALTTTTTYQYPTSLSELLLDSKQNHDDAIYGNPLLYKQCYNALIDRHKHNTQYLYNQARQPPWFWSRESLQATIQSHTLSRALKVSHALALDPPLQPPVLTSVIKSFMNPDLRDRPKAIQWIHSNGSIENERVHLSHQTKLQLMSNRTHLTSLPANPYYYHIPKTGSSSMGAGILKVRNNFSLSVMSENTKTHTQCGFTFVREPVDRFISGYYTVNRLIYGHNVDLKKKKYRHSELFSWWNISGEPQRITAFVNDLVEFGYSFVSMTPLQHVTSQVGILSIGQNDIHFVGRLEKMEEHFGRLRRFCNDTEHLNVYKHVERMKNYGTRHVDIYRDYAEMMSLEHYTEGSVLPGYKAVADSYDLYYKIANYYKQDFVCLGFQANFTEFRHTIYAKIRKWKERRHVDGVLDD